MTEEEKRKYILSIQAPSTRRALERPESEDALYQLRPLSTDWLAVPQAKTWEESVNARPLAYHEVMNYRCHRYDRGRHIAEMRKEKELLSNVTEEKRNLAIAAFMFVKMKFKDLMTEWGLNSETPKTKLKIHEN